MKKELGIAIFIGVLFGFGLSAFFWMRDKGKPTVNNLISKNETTPTEIAQVSPALNDKTSDDNEISLDISSPDNEIISQNENLTIKGKTLPKATVVIIWEEGADIIVADKSGLFETEIDLIGGENNINISAYDDQGNKAAQTLTVTYSTAKF
jgi:hypothetical protein